MLYIYLILVSLLWIFTRIN